MIPILIYQSFAMYYFYQYLNTFLSATALSLLFPQATPAIEQLTKQLSLSTWSAPRQKDASNLELHLGASQLVAQTEPSQEEADRLFQQGIQQSQDNQFEEALEHLQAALQAYREIGDREQESFVLNNLGIIYKNLAQYEQAVEVYGQALEIALELNDHLQKGRVLNNLGIVYSRLGQYRQAIELYNQALNIASEIGHRYLESNALGNLGFAHRRLRQYEQAIDFYKQRLVIVQEIDDFRGEGNALNGLGLVYLNLTQYEQAIEFFEEALVIRHKMEYRRGVGNTLGNLGEAYRYLNQYEHAIDFYEKRLAIVREIGDREGEGRTLSSIGRLLNDQNESELAIVFLKASVEVYESIRSDIRGLDNSLQKSYTDNIVARSYRLLVKLLLEQGRIPEAQQVLDLLQLEEVQEFTNTRAVWTNNGIRLSYPEQTVANAHGSLIALGNKLLECERNNCAELDTLLDQQEGLLAQYNTEVNRFVETIRANRRDDDNFQDPDNISVDARKLLEAYAADEQNTLLVYPFVLEDKLWLVWATVGDVVGSIEVPVTQGELATTVQQFGALLKSRSSDVTELQATSQKLYSWLIHPLAAELEKNDIDHLVFVNDRVTRYIPMGALYDGENENYLLERYTISTVLSPTATDMDDRLGPVTDSNVLGLGLTEAVDIDDQTFNPLPAVRDELAGIIKDQDGDGVYPGQTLLNQAFTLDAFKNNLRGNRILHIATHAAFVPGQPKKSFIVLGDGNPMEIPEIETMSRRLKDLHLVVLSACQTALGETNQEDGTEIAGLSSYFLEANRSGAVVASLWNVNDNSTSVLMQRFYENMAAGDTKADALRKAQLSLLGSDQTADGDARIIGQRQSEDSGAAPLAHPYFWAPFILIGNGL